MEESEQMYITKIRSLDSIASARGFSITECIADSGEHNPKIPIMLAVNSEGKVFAKFYIDRTISTARDMTGPEHEAIDGICSLILKWK